MRLVAFPVFAYRPEIFSQGYTIGVHVDPDEACEEFASEFNEGHIIARVLREVIYVLGVDEFSVGGVCPSVVGAGKCFCFSSP